jgi:type VI secretion system protein ImpJ
MTWHNRVMWSEGLFLRPQHFQQQDRHSEWLVDRRAAPLRPYPWGFTKVKLDETALKSGRIGLAAASGVLDDGLPFDIPTHGDHPPPLAPPPEMRNTLIYLGLPLCRPSAADFSLDPGENSDLRFSASETSAADAIAGSGLEAPMMVARPRFRLLHGQADLGGFSLLPLARLIETRPDGSLALDENFLPTVLHCGAVAGLRDMISEIASLSQHRADAIAARINGSAKGSVAEVSDFMLLQTVNRHALLFDHLKGQHDIHPEEIYRILLGYAGDLATFTAANNRSSLVAGYEHRDLADTFFPVISALRDSLSAVFEQSAIAIPLEQRAFGIRVGKINDKTLFEGCSFVVAARSSIDSETLRGNLPKRITIGAVERIRDLVNLQLVGVPIRPMPVEPRQIPYRANTVYFELNNRHDQWDLVRASGGIAFHVAGDVPDLELDLWAVRGRLS